MRDTRWGRHPAGGTSWPCGGVPGSPSRIRTPRGGGPGLLGEPGRRFFEDLPLFAKDPVLATQSAQLIPLSRGQSVPSTPVVEIGLLDPVADRLGRGLELPSEVFRATPGPDEFDHPTAEFRRVRSVALGHRGPPPLHKGITVHENGSTPLIPGNSVVMTSRATIGECAINRAPV